VSRKGLGEIVCGVPECEKSIGPIHDVLALVPLASFGGYGRCPAV
jgi:hypothetical protein